MKLYPTNRKIFRIIISFSKGEDKWAAEWGVIWGEVWEVEWGGEWEVIRASSKTIRCNKAGNKDLRQMLQT